MEDQHPLFPEWTEIHCGICLNRLMGHTLDELRQCAVKSGRRFGETDGYLLPAHLIVHVGDSEARKRVLEETACRTCGKRIPDHTRDAIEACFDKRRYARK